MTWSIAIAHRSPDEPLVDLLSHCRHLGDEDAAVSRRLILAAMYAGTTSCRELLDNLGALEPHERRVLLDEARAAGGLEPVATIEARERAQTLTVRTRPGGEFPLCAEPGCNAAPMRLGGFYRPGVKRWRCEAHEHRAAPGDLEPVGSGIRLSESGALVPVDPDGDAAERAREASRRDQLQAQAEARAVEAAEAAASTRARDEAARAEMPRHLRELTP